MLHSRPDSLVSTNTGRLYPYADYEIGLVGIQFEEHDLVVVHRKPYTGVQKRLPMLIPRLYGKASADRKPAADAKAADLRK